MADKIKVSAVSYTNTKPFVHGLRQATIAPLIELSLDIPSVCADKLLNNQIDIGLVPVATLLSLPSYHLVSNYCIGAQGAVNSVFIFSNKPIEEIRTIRLDAQSRTSNLLAKVLVKNFWQKEISWVFSGEADAFIEIGDRTFGKKSQYAFSYDLSECWFSYTKMPFVFAAWVSVKELPTAFITLFNESLEQGLHEMNVVIEELEQQSQGINIREYLTQSLDYDFNQAKREALAHFLELAQAL